MDRKEFDVLSAAVAPALAGRRAAKRFFCCPLAAGGPLEDGRFAAANAALLPDGAGEDLRALALAPFWDEYPCPVVVDAAKALALLRQSPDRSPAALAASLSQARFGFMGTDGMRGKVPPAPVADPVAAFLRDNVLSPELVAVASKAFGELCRGAGRAPAASGSPKAVVGNDGRDRAAGWRMNGAMAAGFRSAGFDVRDLGTVPTPYVPWEMLLSGAPCGAALTASHNPANQNGIKFFLDGRKLLPEGPTGDFALSALMLDIALSGGVAGLDPADGSASSSYLDAIAARTLSVLPADTAELLRGARFVADTANGAFFGLAPRILDGLGLRWSTVNASADGANINQGCGVAEIEGHHAFSTEEAQALPIAKALLEAGREEGRGGRRCYGLALDGDGDRGFLLVYDPEKDDVAVLDGDLSGFILAESLLASGGDRTRHFVATVESDLMTAFAARSRLGLPVGIVSVGDKWIGNYAKGRLLVGVEASGHLMFPVPGSGPDGRPFELLSGNGLLSTLSVARALEKAGLLPDAARRPFDPGFSKTLYTFFVDKALFYRGSAAWNADLALIREGFEAAKASGSLPASAELAFEDKEEANLLYAAVYEGGAQIGAVLARNSGTEDKNAVYVQCRRGLEAALLPIGEKVRELHRRKLKNPARVEYDAEKAVLARLAAASPRSFEELAAEVVRELSGRCIRDDVFGVVYGLKKEGAVAWEGDEVRLK